MSTTDLKVPIWEHFSHTSDFHLKRNSVTSCYLGKAYFVKRDRNSYYGSRSKNYFFSSSFHPTLAEAKNYVESRRKMGSSWIIEESPALVMCGKDYAMSLVSAENNNDKFRCFQDIKLVHKTLKKLAEHLQKGINRRIYMYLTHIDTVTPITGPLYTHYSHSNGGQYYLSWNTSGKTRINLNYIFDLQKKIWSLID